MSNDRKSGLVIPATPGFSAQLAKLSSGHGCKTSSADDLKFPFVNCSLDPFCPDGMGVERHERLGVLDAMAFRIENYRNLCPGRASTGTLGYDFLEQIQEKHPLNACAIDALLADHSRIPTWWVDKGIIVFAGTRYRNLVDSQCVRCLAMVNSEWRERSHFLDERFTALHNFALPG